MTDALCPLLMRLLQNKNCRYCIPMPGPPAYCEMNQMFFLLFIFSEFEVPVKVVCMENSAQNGEGGECYFYIKI